MEIDLKQLRDLMRTLKQFDVNEFEIEHGDERIFLRRGELVASPDAMGGRAGHATQSSPPLSERPGGGAGAEPEVEEGVVFVTSPFVGTFYRSPSPDTAPFIEVGQTI